MPRSTEEKGVIRNDNIFSRIEELIKGNTFSRDEISRLIEILDSRVDNGWEKWKPSTEPEVDTQFVSGINEIRRTPSNTKQLDIDRTTVGTSCEKLDVPNGVSASPIDIARAYMAGRVSRGSRDFGNTMSIGERAEPSNEFTRKSFLPPPSPKSSICWPGAMVHDRHGFTTPQSQRGRSMPHDFPRTPYSRTILSKSNTKLQAQSGYGNTSTPFEQSQSSIYGKVKPRSGTVDDYGSVGPIRRVKNKYSSEVRPRGSIFTPSKNSPSKIVIPAFKDFSPSVGRTTELGETSGASKYWPGDNISDLSDRGNSNQNLSSSQTVRKILEHLDRNKPTPKEKEAELKLVTSWRESSPEKNYKFHDENVGSVRVDELAAHKNAERDSTDFSVEYNKNSSNKSSFSVKFQDKDGGEAKGAVSSTNDKASGSDFTGSGIISGANAAPSFELKGPGSLQRSLNENAFATNNHGEPEKISLFSRPRLSNGQDIKTVAGTTGPEFFKNNGNKPSLPSISINKPDLRAFSCGNGPSFTFPISASSGVLSEPPTPSITPLSSSASGVATLPSYTFGTKKSTPPVVFSFPSTSISTSTQDDFDLKFSFGSDKKKPRLSFTSFATDGICY